MASANFLNSGFLGTLKDFYTEGIRENTKNASFPLYRMMVRGGYEEISGERAVYFLGKGVQGGVGARAEGNFLPTASTDETIKANVLMKDIYGNTQFSQKALEASRNNAGAVVDVLTRNLETLERQVKNDTSRQVFGNEDGLIALTTDGGTYDGTNDVTVIAVDDADQFDIGMVIDIIDATDDTTVLVDALRILDVDDNVGATEFAGTITVTGDVTGTLATGDKVFNFDARGLEMNGMEDIIFSDSNTLFGIDRTTNKWFNAQIVPGGSAILDEEILRKAVSRVEVRSDGLFVDILGAKHNIVDGYESGLLSDKRYNVTDTDGPALKGGYKALDFDGIQFFRDRQAKASKAYGFVSGCWFNPMYTDWTFMQHDGNIIDRVENKPEYRMTMYSYQNIFSDKPRANFGINALIGI